MVSSDKLKSSKKSKKSKSKTGVVPGLSFACQIGGYQPAHPTFSDHKSFLKVLNEAQQLRYRKNKDYGSSWRNHGAFGLIVRMSDKMNRLNTLIQSPSKMEIQESLRDTAIDLINYSAMFVMLLDEKNPIDNIQNVLCVECKHKSQKVFCRMGIRMGKVKHHCRFKNGDEK